MRMKPKKNFTDFIMLPLGIIFGIGFVILYILIFGEKVEDPAPQELPPIFEDVSPVGAHFRSGDMDILYGYSEPGYHIVEVRDGENRFIYHADSRDHALDYMVRLIQFERYGVVYGRKETGD